MKTLLTKIKSYKVLIPLILLLIVAGTIFYHTTKSIPDGLSYEGEVYQTDNVRFLYDLTYKDSDGNTRKEQQIFQRVFEAVEEAEEFIVLDMFLFNNYVNEDKNYPKITETLTAALIDMKEEKDVQVHVITDPVNLTYGSHATGHLQEMRDHGIEVIFTNLEPLRDSNPLYSGVWRVFLQWFGQSGEGWLPNPMASTAPDVTLRSYLELLNVKANHRKVLVTDQTAIVASANPHDESGFHSNIALETDGSVIADLLETEQAVADFSGGGKFPEVEKKSDSGFMNVQALTEGKILKHVVNELNDTQPDDKVWIGMFYLAERKVIDAIGKAAERGAEVRIVLDPNKNAFGNKKSGLPNVPVAAELVRMGNDNIKVKWYNTGEEQYHTKLIYFDRGEERMVIGGSANFTRRNLDDLNLETNLKVWGPSDAESMQEVDSYFKRIWTNEDGEYTLAYDENEDKLTAAKYIVYWIQKLLRLTTF
ncbi:phospholipase D family protein [Bacillus sp. FJAT-27251]|uniref:phospholipase D family protein n=1 Tax=Bacillus sp. FJAT-27251 TaxID=1684142 RepID=UPI0006A7E6CA|nr:phospholipase D family protein [Bacillus sp. FJAT-27251]